MAWTQDIPDKQIDSQGGQDIPVGKARLGTHEQLNSFIRFRRNSEHICTWCWDETSQINQHQKRKRGTLSLHQRALVLQKWKDLSQCVHEEHYCSDRPINWSCRKDLRFGILTGRRAAAARTKARWSSEWVGIQPDDRWIIGDREALEASLSDQVGGVIIWVSSMTQCVESEMCLLHQIP